MFAGVGIIGVLASILSSILISPPETAEDEIPAAVPAQGTENELAAIKNEPADICQLLEKISVGTDERD